MGVVRGFPGSEAVLARHARALPQPDQLCGPWAAHVALAALMPAVPTVTDLALASGSRIFPSDVADWRPPGAQLDTSGWAVLPHVEAADLSGTDATGLAAGVDALTGAAVVPVASTGLSDLAPLLTRLLAGPPVGVVANVRTGAMGPLSGFDVGHFIVVWGVSEDGEWAGVADSYAELGTPGQPPGCRVVETAALHAGVSAPPGRGLLLLSAASDAAAVRALVADTGATSALWKT